MSNLSDRDHYYQRLDQLRAAHPEIYALRDSDNFLRRWSEMWGRSEMSMEEGLARLALLLCEHNKQLIGKLTEHVSITPSPYIFGVDFAKEGSERTAVYPSGDLQAGKNWDDMPIARKSFSEAVIHGRSIMRISPMDFWEKLPEDKKADDDAAPESPEEPRPQKLRDMFKLRF